jgi:hypothetical protein
MWTRSALVVSLLGSACSGGTAAKPPPTGQSAQAGGGAAASANEPCAIAVEKVFAYLKKQGYDGDPSERGRALEECRKKPDDPIVPCVVASKDDGELERCMKPAPKGEPADQLDQAAENLRTYCFIHETFTDQNIGLTPAKPCCQFPNRKCPPETAPNEYLTDILQLDLSTERLFQYRVESSSKKAVIEAVGDRDCDGKTVTYRRELEWRADGNMHITVVDPPADSD